MFSQGNCLDLVAPSPEHRSPGPQRRPGRAAAAAAPEVGWERPFRGSPPDRRDSRISQGLLFLHPGTSSSLEGLQHSIPCSHGHSASLQLFPPWAAVTGLSPASPYLSDDRSSSVMLRRSSLSTPAGSGESVTGSGGQAHSPPGDSPAEPPFGQCVLRL